MINKVTDINVSFEEDKAWKRIVGFIFTVSKKTKILHQNTHSIQNEISLEQNGKSILEAEFVQLGISIKDFNKLLQEQGEGYLEQLILYVKYKKWQVKGKSVKNYLFGILKNNPSIDELKTPNCLVKEKQFKLAVRVKKEQVKTLEKQESERKENELNNANVQSYLSNLSSSQLKALKTEFNNSQFARGLKFWQAEVDFEKSFVQATFYSFINHKMQNG